MAEVGTMGDIQFTVSSRKVYTFSDYGRSSEPRIATHEIIGKKPILEFINPGLEEVSMTITLSAAFGVNPYEEVEKLRRMRDTGEVFNVFIGGKPLSQNQWMLVSMPEKVNAWDGRGNMLSLTVTVTLREYVVREEGGSDGSNN